MIHHLYTQRSGKTSAEVNSMYHFFCFETGCKPRALVSKSKISLCPPPLQLPNHFLSLCYKKVILLPALALNVNTGHFKLFEQTTNAVDFSREDSLQIMCADLQCEAIYFPSYRVYLLPALGATKDKKSTEEVICNDGAEAEEAWCGIRRTIHSLARSPLSVTVPRHTHAHTRTHSHTPNQSPLIGEIAFKGRVKKEKKEEMFHSVHSIAKIKLSQEVVVFP